MAHIDQKKKAILYAYELDYNVEQDSNQTGDTINSQDMEEMRKIVSPLLETSTELDGLDDSILTGAEEYEAEYVEALEDMKDAKPVVLLQKMHSADPKLE